MVGTVELFFGTVPVLELEQLEQLRYFSGMTHPNEDPELFKKWASKIQRADRKISFYKSKVCSLHFRDDLIIRHYTHVMPDGEVCQIERGVPVLKKGAIPSIFPERPRQDTEPKYFHRLCSCHFKDGLKSNGPTIFERNENSSSHLDSTEKRNSDVPCSAPNCDNSEKMGFQLFRFPSKKEIRNVWLEVCRRVGVMKPSSPDSPLRLCEAHFESEQFLKRKTKSLKAEAIPTIFNESNVKVEPTSEQRSPSPECYSPADLDAGGSSPPGSSSRTASASPPPANDLLTADLLQQISRLTHKLQKTEWMLKSFLTNEQIQALSASYDEEDVKVNSLWNSESIAQGLKFQFNLGSHGYNFLRSTNYPLPDVETLNSRLGDNVINFGVFEDLSDLIQCKVQSLDPLDRLCAISLDEMKFSDFKSTTKEKQHLISGEFGEDDTATDGNYITVVMVKGLRSSWEQIIACDLTTSDGDGMTQTSLLEKSISFAEDCGLRILSFSSNLTPNSRLMWNEFGIDVNKNKIDRIAHFIFNDHSIHVVPDVSHLLKSLKAAVDSGIHLPQSLVDSEALPCTHVSSKYVKELMGSETVKKSRSTGKDVESDTDEGSLASAVQFFSVKTATALESAVSSRTVSPDALSTAYFCRLVEQWFSICDSKSLDDGITVDNKQTKFEFLEKFVDIIRDVKIDNGWSPINAAIMMSTISFREVANILLQQEGFGVVLLNRFSRKRVENVISQICECSGSTPTQFSVQSLEVLKTITINQLVSDVDRSFHPNTNWIRTTNDSTSPRTTDDQKPHQRSRKVLERVNSSEAASKPQKRKRGEIESSRRNGSAGKSKKTSKAAEFKSEKQKGKDIKSKYGAEDLVCVMGRPKRKYTSKNKSEDFVYD